MTAPTSTDAAVEAVALAIDESISEWVQLRTSDHGYEADPRDLARIAVEALITAGWYPTVSLDSPDQPLTADTEWGVDWGHDHHGQRDIELRDDEAAARRVAAEHPEVVVSVVSRTVTYGPWIAP